MAFNGFSEETGTFLWDLAFNNERPWFLANKARFETVLNGPFRELAKEVCEKMSLRFPEEDWLSHISRIYRDARRLFGRGPYKDHLWFTVTTAVSREHGPSFWFEIGAASYAYGVGLWAPSAAVMDAFRRAVTADSAAFERLASDAAALDGFALRGELFRRPKGSISPVIDPWYNSRYIDFSVLRDYDELLYSEDLSGRLVQDWSALMPLFRFLEKASRTVSS